MVIAACTSCKKDETVVSIPPTPTPTENYVFKQTAYPEQDGYWTGGSWYPVFTYRLAIMADAQVDSMTLKMTIVLNDSSSIVVTEADLTNFSQMGIYAPGYEYPEYWIVSLRDSRGICPPFYGFLQTDIYRFEYQATVKIKGNWYTVPKGGRKRTDLFESFWV